MGKNSSIFDERAYVPKNITLGIIIGGLIGMLTGILHRSGILIIPVFSNIFSAIPFNEVITGSLLGLIIGATVGVILTLYFSENEGVGRVLETNIPKQFLYDDNENITLQIKEEQLSIAKKLIQTGDVKVYRETFTDEKNFTVPIMREDLVIEKKDLALGDIDYNDAPIETIRIPLSEEKVSFTKHKVDLEDVSVYRQEIKDIKHIEKTLKREEAKITTSGSPEVKDK